MSQHSIGMDSIGMDSIGVDRAPSDGSVEPIPDAPLALPVGSDGLDRRRLLQGVGALAVLGMVGGPGRAVADDEETSATAGADQRSVKSEPESPKEEPPDPGSQDGDTSEDHPDNAPPDKVVLSFFYNGTDSNYDDDFERNGRFQHGELVSRLGCYAQAASKTRADGTQKNYSARRFDGVGFSKRHRSLSQRIFGTMLGKGMLNDVNSIVDAVMDERNRIIREYHANDNGTTGPKELCVTLLGWSRGGVGCIYAANKIATRWAAAERSTKGADNANCLDLWRGKQCREPKELSLIHI